MKQLVELTSAGRLRYHLHAGQARAWASTKRIVSVLAGTQSGKTEFGPPWLYREIQRCGPGDYLVIAPTYPLLTKKVLPALLRLFQEQLQLGDYHTQHRIFTFSCGGQQRTHGAVGNVRTCVFFGHATDPESLESATAKAAWLDEAGQNKFRLGSWDAIRRRLSIHQGRVLITTTPYNLGWLKQQIWDPWHAASRRHAEIDVISFRSIDNPAFPPEEYERARRSLPAWKFLMFYEGQFTRPAGLIYDAFDPERHKVPRFAVPDHWPRYLGLDFGGVNTAGVFFAEETNAATKQPTGRLYAYREYKAGSRTAREHAEALRAGEPMLPMCVGGSKSEGQWRSEFRAAGLPVREPDVTGPDSVEVGVDRVYGAFRRNEVFVFDDLAGFLEEVGSYSRELDDAGEPTEKIADKESYHHLDACRYVLGWLKRPGAGPIIVNEDAGPGRSLVGDAPAGVFLR